MSTAVPAWPRALVLLGLAGMLIVSATVALIRYRPAQPIEILLPDEPSLIGQVTIGGAVANPGVYPYAGADTLAGLLQSAGGATDGADPGSLQLRIPETNSLNSPQKVNINRAEAWLLEALPGIGATRAAAIVAYRQQNGPFRHTSELMKIEGIGQSVYDGIEELITVAD